MKKRYEIIDNAFNRTNYPDMIGQILDNPPAYANVRLIKDKIPMEKIYNMQSKMLEDPSAETTIDDFALKCIKEGYDKAEVVEGIRELYRQAPEVGRNIFDRAVLNYMGIKDKINMKKAFNLKNIELKSLAEKMMPGQKPYTKEELKKLHKMVGDAAKGDPGEKDEEEVLKERDKKEKRAFIDAVKTVEASIKSKMIKTLQLSIRQEDRALETLQTKKEFPKSMGGMSSVEAATLLRTQGYTDERLAKMLRKWNYSEEEIKGLGVKIDTTDVDTKTDYGWQGVK